MRLLKKLAIGMTLLTMLLVLVTLLMLSATRIESTVNGVHTRLLLPTGTDKKIAVPIYAGTGDSPVLSGFLDGPVVRLADNGQWHARWFCEKQVVETRGTASTIDIDCGGMRHSFPIASEPPVPAEVVGTPERMLVLSDIEGNARFLDAALHELGVMNLAGEWIYGSGHLVIAGDAVDRGRDVFAVLWRLYALSLAAARQGGAVHVVLGNHEQYMLLGNISRANREHIFALEQLGGQAAAFAPETILGHWLRQQSVAIKAGSVMVTHGGASPAVVATGLNIPHLNDAMRRYWRGAPATKAELEAVIGRAGLTQYRGYFDAAENLYGRASAQEVAAVLEHFEAATMVVGHTTVERITQLYGGRIYAINVNSPTAASEALLFERGAARVISLNATRDLQPADARSRPFRLLSGEDWRMLGRQLQSQMALARLPYPY